MGLVGFGRVWFGLVGPGPGVSLGGAAAPKRRYGLISGPFWGAFKISESLVRSAPACAIPITAAPPSSASCRYSVSPGMRSDGDSARRAQAGAGAGPRTSRRPRTASDFARRASKPVKSWPYGPLAPPPLSGPRARRGPRGQMCRFFWGRRAAPWASGRRRWLFRPCGGLAVRNRALARRMAPLGPGVTTLSSPPLGTIATTPECVQDYMIAWHARLGPILCHSARAVSQRDDSVMGAPNRHMTQDTSTRDDIRPAFARARERPS